MVERLTRPPLLLRCPGLTFFVVAPAKLTEEKLEWGWNAHAETYYVSAKVGQKGTRFLAGGGGDW